MLSDKDIDVLLYYLDRGIREEIQRICDADAVTASCESLVTAEDRALAKSMGIAF
jgi:hypothetical protein